MARRWWFLTPDNNRVLIWRTIPTVNDAPADIVVGQVNFSDSGHNFNSGSASPNERGLRGPQGVWIRTAGSTLPIRRIIA